MRVFVKLVLHGVLVPRTVFVIVIGSHSAAEEQIPSLKWTGHPHPA